MFKGWVDKFGAAITVMDTEGNILDMNDAAMQALSGGRNMIGENLMKCHQQASIDKMHDMMKNDHPNVYTIEKNGRKKMIYQAPWYKEDVWRRLGSIPDYGVHLGLEVGTHDYRRAVFEFSGRPQAMSRKFIEKLDEKSSREELVRGLIRLIRVMHETEPALSHRFLTPECIYVCGEGRGLNPYIVGFRSVRPAAVRSDYPARGMLDDYFNSINMQKFIAPEIRNGTDSDESDGKSADIYSLGKLIRYIYGQDENRVRDYVEQLIVKDPANRPSIASAARMYDDEVVYFEPTVLMGNEVLTVPFSSSQDRQHKTPIPT